MHVLKKAQIEDFLRNRIDAQASDLGDLIELMRVTELARGATFQSFGAPCQRVALVLTGLFKVQKLYPDGTERNIAFVGENQVIADCTALVSAGPSDVSIIAMTNCAVASIDVATLMHFVRRRGRDWRRLLQVFLHEELLRTAQRLDQFMSLDALERYEVFKREHRNLLARIPQRDVAAYIGVTPVSLSRLVATRRKRRLG